MHVICVRLIVVVSSVSNLPSGLEIDFGSVHPEESRGGKRPSNGKSLRGDGEDKADGHGDEDWIGWVELWGVKGSGDKVKVGGGNKAGG
jgi:hypothetical protein